MSGIVEIVGPVTIPVPVAQSAAGTTHIVEAVADKTVCIHEVSLSLSIAGTVVLQDTDGRVLATWNVATNGLLTLPPMLQRMAGRSLAAGKGLDLVTTTGAGKGFIVYSLA